MTLAFASGEIPRIPLNLVLLKGVSVRGFHMRDVATHDPDALEHADRELLALWASGHVAPHIGATFTLDDTAAALRYVADGRVIGNIVNTVG